jgi:hypothetical protein
MTFNSSWLSIIIKLYYGTFTLLNKISKPDVVNKAWLMQYKNKRQIVKQKWTNTFIFEKNCINLAKQNKNYFVKV